MTRPLLYNDLKRTWKEKAKAQVDFLSRYWLGASEESSKDLSQDI
jgi:hypothetical protein